MQGQSWKPYIISAILVLLFVCAVVLYYSFPFFRPGVYVSAEPASQQEIMTGGDIQSEDTGS